MLSSRRENTNNNLELSQNFPTIVFAYEMDERIELEELNQNSGH